MKNRKTYALDWRDIANIAFWPALLVWFLTYTSMR